MLASAVSSDAGNSAMLGMLTAPVCPNAYHTLCWCIMQLGLCPLIDDAHCSVTVQT